MNNNFQIIVSQAVKKAGIMASEIDITDSMISIKTNILKMGQGDILRKSLSSYSQDVFIFGTFDLITAKGA